MMNRYILIICMWACATGLLAQSDCWPTGFTHDLQQKNQWLSCEATDSPNPNRGRSIWLMYDFQEIYQLGATTIWNFNEPGFLSQGITQLGIDYSIDGRNWTAGPNINLELATGERDYEGQLALDFSGTPARYVLLTALSTAEPTVSCAGLAEVRFEVQGVVTSTEEILTAQNLDVFPNPTQGVFQISLPSEELEMIMIYDSQGKELRRLNAQGRRMELNISNYPPGAYLIRAIDRKGNQYRQKLTKI